MIRRFSSVKSIKNTKPLGGIRITVLAMLSLFILIALSVSSNLEVATVAGCIKEYGYSAAERTCKSAEDSDINILGGRCLINTECKDKNGIYKKTRYHGLLEDTKNLHNCDGKLQVGYCSEDIDR